MHLIHLWKLQPMISLKFSKQRLRTNKLKRFVNWRIFFVRNETFFTHYLIHLSDRNRSYLNFKHEIVIICVLLPNLLHIFLIINMYKLCMCKILISHRLLCTLRWFDHSLVGRKMMLKISSFLFSLKQTCCSATLFEEGKWFAVCA